MIYCVEDDNAIRDLMLYTLGASGFQTKGFPDSTFFWQAMTEEKPAPGCLRYGQHSCDYGNRQGQRI